MVYSNTYTGFILRYLGALETYSHCLICFIMSVISKDIFLAIMSNWGLRLAQKVKTIVNDFHENLHIYCGHLDLSLVKNSGGCSAPFHVN